MSFKYCDYSCVDGATNINERDSISPNYCESFTTVGSSVGAGKFMRTIWDNRRTTEPKYSGCFDVVGDNVETVHIKRVLYNDPVVVVWWSDGTVTRSKVRGDDKYSPEAGLMYCIIKKLAPKTKLDDITADWIPEQQPIEWNMQYVDIKDVKAKHK